MDQNLAKYLTKVQISSEILVKKAQGQKKVKVCPRKYGIKYMIPPPPRIS